MYNSINLMKYSKLTRIIISATPLLTMFSCASKGRDSGNQDSSQEQSSSRVLSSIEQSSTSVFVDPNNVLFPSVYSIEQNLKSQFSVTLECEVDDKHEEITFTRYNQYTKFESSIDEDGLNCFVNNGSGTGFFYSKDSDGRYSSFTTGEFDLNQYYRKAYVGCFAGVEYVFKSNEEIEYLGRNCIKYTNKEDPDESARESLILDKETGLVLHYDLGYVTEGLALDTWTTQFKFDVKEIHLGQEVKDTINEDIESVRVEPLSSTTLKKLGFQGELETPNFSIYDCSTKWQSDGLDEYKIEYRDRVNSGNDSYINQFETFTTCLYNMGFNKASSESSVDSDYEELIVDSTIDYDADISFSAFASVNSTTYKVDSHLTINGGQASITFILTHIA